MTYDREDREPSDEIDKPFAVWYGSVGPTTLREGNHTSNNSDLDANTEGHAEDTSPDDGIDSAVSMET